MSEVDSLVRTLKQLLKEKSVTQYDVAVVLNLGIARVKQMFSQNDFNIKRMVKICNQLLDLDLADLVRISQERRQYIQVLTEEQEKNLIADIRLLIVAVSVMNNWSPKEIVGRYEISQRECQQYLKKLEKLKLLQIQSNDHIKLLIDQNFQWIKDGPFETYFREHVQSDFLDAGFNRDGETRLFRTGMLSTKSADELIRRIDKLVAEFTELNRDDAKLDLNHRTGYSFVVALRPWFMPAFTRFVRSRN